MNSERYHSETPIIQNERPEFLFKESILKTILNYSLLFGIIGPIIGSAIFSITITIFTFNIDKLMFLFGPFFVFAYLIGGIPAVLTGAWSGFLSRIISDKFTVGFLTALGGFFATPLCMVLIDLYWFGHFKIPTSMNSVIIFLGSLLGGLSAPLCLLLARRWLSSSDVQ